MSVLLVPPGPSTTLYAGMVLLLPSGYCPLLPGSIYYQPARVEALVRPSQSRVHTFSANRNSVVKREIPVFYDISTRNQPA